MIIVALERPFVVRQQLLVLEILQPDVLFLHTAQRSLQLIEMCSRVELQITFVLEAVSAVNQVQLASPLVA